MNEGNVPWWLFLPLVVVPGLLIANGGSLLMATALFGGIAGLIALHACLANYRPKGALALIRVISGLLSLWAGANGVALLIYLLFGSSPSVTSEMIVAKDSSVYVFSMIAHFVAAVVYGLGVLFLSQTQRQNARSKIQTGSASLGLVFVTAIWLLFAWGEGTLATRPQFDLWIDTPNQRLIRFEGSFILPTVPEKPIQFADIQRVTGAFVQHKRGDPELLIYTGGLFYTYEVDIVTIDGSRISVMRTFNKPGLGVPAEANNLANVLEQAFHPDITLSNQVQDRK